MFREIRMTKGTAMAGKALIRNTISGVLAIAFAAGALPSAAHADPDRDERRAPRQGGAMPSAPRPQPRIEAPMPQQRAWTQQQRTPMPAQAPDRGSAWQNGRPAGMPSGDRNAANGGWQNPQRNPAYADPRRNPSYTAPRQDQRPQPSVDPRQRPAGDINHTETWSRNQNGQWYRDSGWQWRQDKGGQWYRDHDQNWSRDNQNRWYRDNRPEDQRGYNPTRDRDGRNGWDNRGGDNRRWNNDWRRDNRYDWNGWRNEHRDRFHGYYNAPYGGYSYSRLGIGVFLGSPWYGDNYWINDPWDYRLPDAYGPYRWIRYYDDVMLVDTNTGEVVDVIYDFFW